MGASSRDRIKEETVQRAVNALLKWRKKNEASANEQGEEVDDFMYLSVALIKPPSEQLSHSTENPTPQFINLRRDIHLSRCRWQENHCRDSHTILKSRDIPHVKQVLKLSKLKSDYKSFVSKKKLYDSFDLFLAAVNVAPLLHKVLGKVFYNKKRKIPVPVDLLADGSNWKEEIESARKSSLLCFSRGTCSSMRVGRWGMMQSQEIVENVFDAIDGVVGIAPKKWRGIKCLHLKLKDSVALPVYEKHQSLATGR